MTCVFFVQGDELQLDRTSKNFPASEFDTAVDLLQQNLNEERERMESHVAVE